MCVWESGREREIWIKERKKEQRYQMTVYIYEFSHINIFLGDKKFFRTKEVVYFVVLSKVIVILLLLLQPPEQIYTDESKR